MRHKTFRSSIAAQSPCTYLDYYDGFGLDPHNSRFKVDCCNAGTGSRVLHGTQYNFNFL